MRGIKKGVILLSFILFMGLFTNVNNSATTVNASTVVISKNVSVTQYYPSGSAISSTYYYNSDGFSGTLSLYSVQNAGGGAYVGIYTGTVYRYQVT